jgi:hypothetical protein
MRNEENKRMKLMKGTLKSFSVVSYRATIQLADSYKAYLKDVSVARNLPVTEMTAGRKSAVLFFNKHNPKEAIVIAIY